MSGAMGDLCARARVSVCVCVYRGEGEVLEGVFQVQVGC